MEPGMACAGRTEQKTGASLLDRLNRHFASRELVTMGTFAALIQIASMVVALMGGGMNPLSLVLKNIIFTTLLMVLLTKIAKKGTLCLFGLISSLFSLVAMGSGAILQIGRAHV
jgi:energy-coupling factor transport system substrate-specific component